MSKRQEEIMIHRTGITSQRSLQSLHHPGRKLSEGLSSRISKISHLESDRKQDQNFNESSLQLPSILGPNKQAINDYCLTSNTRDNYNKTDIKAKI